MFRKILLHPMHKSTPHSPKPAGGDRVDHQAGGGSQAPQAVASGESEVLGVSHAVFRQVSLGAAE